MSIHAIAGLLALNAWLLATGIAVLFLLRGWGSWGELLRLAGLAYMLGLASMGVAWVWELVVGINLSFATIFGTGVFIAACATLGGHRLGRRVPRQPTLRVPRPGLPIVAAASGALTVVYVEALFRSGRLAGLYEFDGWSFWVPKAKAIYYFGGLDHQFFRELTNPSYPPLAPALEAAAFHLMGSPDAVTVHLQFWFVLVGFVGAVVGLLSQRIPAILIWPSLLLVLVTPHVVGYALQPQADFLLDGFFVIAALLVALWLVERRDWQLVAAAVLLAAGMLTKREGYLFAACVVLAALAASWRGARAVWPRIVATGVAAVAATVPWRVLLAVRHLGGGGPEAGGQGLFSHLDRAWPSLKLTLSTLFDFHIWLVVVPLVVLAVAAAFVGGARILPSYAVSLYLLGVAGLTWATWAFPSIPITKNAAVNPIVRLSGSLVLLMPALAPLLLAAAWRRDDGRGKAS